jgi:hypothetical protein
MSDHKSEIEAREEIVRRAAKALSEHFENVRIFCNSTVPGEDKVNYFFSYGTGNWFAQYGQVVDWVTRMDESSRVDTRPENQ